MSLCRSHSTPSRDGIEVFMGVAARLHWKKVGEFTELKNLSVTRLKNQIEFVLSNPIYAANARAMRDAIRKAGGTQRAANLIETTIDSALPYHQTSAGSLSQGTSVFSF